MRFAVRPLRAGLLRPPQRRPLDDGQEFGVFRSHMATFRQRRDRVGFEYRNNYNRLTIRLEKLKKLYADTPGAKLLVSRKALEQVGSARVL